MKKGLISICLVLAMCLSLYMPAGATNIADEETSNKQNEFSLTLTNDTTGEVQVINATRMTSNMLTRSANSEVTVGYSAFVPIPTYATLSTTQPGGKSDGSGVSVLFYVVYTISTNHEKIKVSRIYGSWTPTSNLYAISNREVGMHAGLDSPGTLLKYPSSNSFDYSTGWGYCNFVTAGDASPYAWADATISVYGMSGTHSLTVGFSFPESRQ